jgi:hypothetical protein
MILLMLVPATLKGKAQKKYYDWSARFELTKLHKDGIDGVKVKIFGSSMDTPGRAELLGLEASGAYQSCCVCLHDWTKGLRSKCIYDGYRRLLTAGSQGRQQRLRYKSNVYEFKDICTESAPMHRTNQFVVEAVTVAVRNKLKAFLGHKHLPMQSEWPGFKWYQQNIPDLMHDTKLMCEMLLKILVGRASEGWYKSWDRDSKHRAECEVSITHHHTLTPYTLTHITTHTPGAWCF